MSDYHKELLDEILKDWTTEQLEVYITGLEERLTQLDNWVGHLKTIRKKKLRKRPVDTGVRGGL